MLEDMQESNSGGVGLSCFVLNRLVGEYMKNGFVKIGQKLVDWQWYDDNNVKVVFLHLLLTANQKPKLWHGQELAAGELVTSLRSMAKILKFSRQQLRTALDKLKQTGEISITTNKHHTKITIHNWEYYQLDDNQPSNHPKTGKTPAKCCAVVELQPSNNQPVTIQQPTDNQQNNHPTTDKTPAKPCQNKEMQPIANHPITNHATIQQPTEPPSRERKEKKEKEPKRKKRKEREGENNNSPENLCLDSAAQNFGGSSDYLTVFSLFRLIKDSPLTEVEKNMLVSFVNEYGKDWTVEALNIMGCNKAKTLVYPKNILHRWRTEGKDTLPPWKKKQAQTERIMTNNTDYNAIYALSASKMRQTAKFENNGAGAEDEPISRHRRLIQ